MTSSLPPRSLLFLIFTSIVLLGGPVRSATSSSSSSQPYRTAYHFQPSSHWINDPNGPMVYKGIYHLFYQYNPRAAVWQWGRIVWAHSTSTDLVNWASRPIAIQPSQQSDIHRCWSGSATILPGGRPAILYTGIDHRNYQVQNLIVPRNYSDPFLSEWVKSNRNPVMAPTQGNEINSSSFRDPSTAWLGPDKEWRVLVGSLLYSRGLVLLFRSKDFLRWVKAKTLHSIEGNGTCECPDFYPVDTVSRGGLDTSAYGRKFKHVLKVSLDYTKHDHYVVGKYDFTKDVYIADKGQTEGEGGRRYDYGKFYASKTFFDYEKKRRILWGWVNESSSDDEDVKKGWAGVQAIPRTVWLDASGQQLLQWPIVEIERLRTKKVELTPQVLKSGTTIEVLSVSAAQADIEGTFEVSRLDEAEDFDPNWKDPQILCNEKGASVKGRVGPFGLYVMASRGLEEFTGVFFRVFTGRHKALVVLLCSDLSRSSLHEDYDKRSFGTFLDVDPVNGKLSLSLRCLVCSPATLCANTETSAERGKEVLTQAHLFSLWSHIDHSIVEAFGRGGKVCITARVYPTRAIAGATHISVFNNGAKDVGLANFSAWNMKKAMIN